MENNKLMDTLFEPVPGSAGLWEGRYKIPWDEPGFSARMLREHLSQDHDLASRKQETIKAQAEWIHQNLCDGKPRRLLDLGCGPGFYLRAFLDKGYACRGIDFSPASIAHARKTLGQDPELVLGDLRSADFGQGFDLAAMIFGEFNVFSPEEARTILKKAHNALVPGGTLLIEAQAPETVKRSGLAPPTWTKNESGLFSDARHLLLVENHWLSEEAVALQRFFVIHEDGGVEAFRSTTRAVSMEEFSALLTEAGFSDMQTHPDWPVQSPDLFALTAKKAV